MGVDVLLDAAAGELADDPPAPAPAATDASSGGAKEPTASPTPPPNPNPSRPRLPHVCRTDTAVWGVRHQDHAVDRDLCVPDERAQREVIGAPPGAPPATLMS